MQPFRATLTDDAGQAIADVEGSMQAAEGSPGACQGTFEFQETAEFMQGVLEEKTFRLKVDDGRQLAIRVDSASTTSRPGFTKVEFSSA
jgi:hypothetical protein